MNPAFVQVLSNTVRLSFSGTIRRAAAAPHLRNVCNSPLQRASVKRAVKSNRTMTTVASTKVSLSDNIDVHIVPILDDNFSYLVHDKSTSTAALVDPATPVPLVTLAAKLGANITTSLTTHKHWDHAGGNKQLAQLIPNVDIVGSVYEQAEAVSVPLPSGAHHTIRGSQISVSTLHTPCHTAGHLCFTLSVSDRQAVFTGDTLFVAGCGKFFEGNATDMHNSLNATLAQLPDDTLVFCGHEYTITNLKFAASVEPENKYVSEKLEWAKQQVENGEPTVPTSIADEKKTNPFMRNHLPEMKEALGMQGADDVAVMKELRERKNNFRP